MTAIRSAIGTNVATGQPGWQVRWARRENERRQRAYEAAVEAWRRREEQLVRLRIEAAGFLGCTQPRTGLPAELADDEVVYRVLPTADLVEAEARHLTGLPAPALTIATAPVGEPGPLPAGLRVVDTGMAVVTNLRVAFAGRTGRREWWHADVRGPAHHPELPITLLPTTDGRRPAGLQVPAAVAVNFRFYLTLAFATASGDRAAIAPQVDTLLAAHHQARPVPPPPAAPADAPMPLLRPERLAAAGAVAVAVTIGVLAAGTVNAPAEAPHRAEPGASGIAADADGRGSIGRAFPTAPAANPTGEPVPSRTAGSGTRPTGGAGGAGRPVPAGAPVPAEAAAEAPAGVAPGPTRTAGPEPTTPAPPATTDPPRATPTPNDPAPTADPPGTILCLQPLQLPIVGPLLCPGA